VRRDPDQGGSLAFRDQVAKMTSLTFRLFRQKARMFHTQIDKEDTMRWSKPAFEDLRLGFEVTMYIFNR
jgi:coenzyme PQQ precursor peptide PqqA